MIRAQANSLVTEINKAKNDIFSVEQTMSTFENTDSEDYLECQIIFNFLKDTLQYLEEDLFIDYNLSLFELDKIMLGQQLSNDIKI